MFIFCNIFNHLLAIFKAAEPVVQIISLDPLGDHITLRCIECGQSERGSKNDDIASVGGRSRHPQPVSRSGKG
jgi:hypothetical protein